MRFSGSGVCWVTPLPLLLLAALLLGLWVHPLLAAFSQKIFFK